jgi:hypothetical protein
LLDLLEVAVEGFELVRVSQDPWISELQHAAAKAMDMVLAVAAGMEQAYVDLVMAPVDLVGLDLV